MVFLTNTRRLEALLDSNSFLCKHWHKRYWFIRIRRVPILNQFTTRFQDVLITTDLYSFYNGSRTFYARFYDKTSGKELTDKRIGVSREIFYGTCMYHGDNQPAKPEQGEYNVSWNIVFFIWQYKKAFIKHICKFIEIL